MNTNDLNAISKPISLLVDRDSGYAFLTSENNICLSYNIQWATDCKHVCNCTVREIFGENDFVRIRKRIHFRSLFAFYYDVILHCVMKSVICNVEHPIIAQQQ